MSSPTARVVITDFIPVDDPLTPERSALDGVAEVIAIDCHDESELRGPIDDADAIIVYHNISKISEPTIARMKRCRLISRGGVGFDNIDSAFARQQGIAVTNVPDYGTEEVADSAIGLTLALARGISRLNSHLRDGGGPWMYTVGRPVHRLRGRVFGIVGLGRIGTATAVRAKALGMDVAFYDPYKPDGHDKALGVRRVASMDELLAESFVLSLHCPATEETHHLIDAEALGRMQTGAYLVNTARGRVVDTAALPDALASGKLAGVGIDVLPIEPPVEGDPLIEAWRDPQHPAYHRTIINPHAAFYCEEGFEELRYKAALACRRAILGEPLPNVVN